MSGLRDNQARTNRPLPGEKGGIHMNFGRMDADGGVTITRKAEAPMNLTREEFADLQARGLYGKAVGENMIIAPWGFIYARDPVTILANLQKCWTGVVFEVHHE